jgi:DNA-binding transcriptional LysR family regulator
MIATMDMATDDLRLLVRCVSEGSLSAAARAMGFTQAAATRRIQRLEASVGGPVLHRTTRSLRPTVEGERLLRVARRIVAELAQFERERSTTSSTALGDVRVSAPVLLGQSVGSMLATALASQHPGLRLVLSLSNTVVDLVRDTVDVALRVGSLKSSSLVGTRIAIARIGVYASSATLAAAQHPSDLMEARWISHPRDTSMRATGPHGQRFQATVEPTFICDDRSVVRETIVSGLGIGLLPTFFGDAEPTLRRLVPQWHFGTVPVVAVWLPEARHDLRVRAVVEVMKQWGRAGALVDNNFKNER